MKIDSTTRSLSDKRKKERKKKAVVFVDYFFNLVPRRWMQLSTRGQSQTISIKCKQDWFRLHSRLL